MSHALILQADGTISNEDFAKILLAIKRQNTPHFQHIHLDFDVVSKEQMQELTLAIQEAALTTLDMAFTQVDDESAKAFQEAVSNNQQITRTKLILGKPIFYFRAATFNDLNKDLDMGFNQCAIIDCQSLSAEQMVLVVDKVKACGVTDLTLTVREINLQLAESLAQALCQIERLKKIELNLGEFTVSKAPEEEDLIEKFASMMVTAVETNAGRLAQSMKGAASQFLTQSTTFMSSFTLPFAQCMAAHPDDEHLALMNDPNKREKAALGKLV
ncbi:MAG: hypothetical protein AB7I18_04215 [Candidatus Berkiella sp.]